MGYNGGGWPYGGVNMEFKSGTLDTSSHSRKMNFRCANAVVCDKNGDLLFYTNGIDIANSIDSPMVNGIGLNPSFYTSTYKDDGLLITQADLIIPVPGDTTKYYLFHQTDDDYATVTHTDCALYFYYSIIDMSLDSGRGAVTQKNVVLYNDSLACGFLTACKHANGRDWWVMTHLYNNTKYLKYLVTSHGIQGPFIQSIGTHRGVGLGQCVFSPDGNKFGYYSPIWQQPKTNHLDIFDFDRCTGKLSNTVTVAINDTASIGGVAFSPNSKVLYVSSVFYVYQFDLLAANIISSKTTVAVWDSTYSPSFPLATTFFLSQLAPDGNIYINCGNATLDIHVINNPDSLGLSCDVCQHCVHLPAFNAFTIANHPNYFLGPEAGSPCDTIVTIDDRPWTADNTFQAFPNPINSGNQITFTYPSTGEQCIITIYNIEGSEVSTYKLRQWSSIQHLKLPALPQGIYMAKLTADTESKSVKFVVE